MAVHGSWMIVGLLVRVLVSQVRFEKGGTYCRCVARLIENRFRCHGNMHLNNVSKHCRHPSYCFSPFVQPFLIQRAAFSALEHGHGTRGSVTLLDMAVGVGNLQNGIR